jgi:hypothetical protein
VQTPEERFWSRVWQCEHRHPCKRCCWPWIGSMGVGIYDDLQQCYRRKHSAASFYDPDLQRTLGAHVCAYIFGKAYGQLLIPGRLTHVCHSCDYQHCCNYRHLSLGAPADNGRDKYGKTLAVRSTQPIWFPDGRMLTFPRYCLGYTGNGPSILIHDSHRALSA